MMPRDPATYGEWVSFWSWLGTAWYLWIVVPVVVAGIVALVVVSKARARARARIPQYRRREPAIVVRGTDS